MQGTPANGEKQITSKRQILRRQRGWARSAGLAPDTRGYLDCVEHNLFKPLSPSTLAAFERAGVAELQNRPSRPAKMRALHSSAVLAVNVFDYWVGRDAALLLAALGIDSNVKALWFEAELPTGLAASSPKLDVALELANAMLVGIESKFTEWLTPKRASRPAFKTKYFEAGRAHWADAGLPKCQELAVDLMSGRERYRYLDAAQLLKHALGLATQCPRRFTLRYLYFDAPGRARAVHRAELARFTARVDATLGFEALSYQNLYAALAASDAVDADYLAYLGSRYM